MLDASKKKQVNCLKLWMKNTKTKNRIFEHESNIRSIQKRFMNKLLATKAGRVLEAMRKFRGLPEKKDR